MRNSCYSFLSILRKFSANILGINEEVWPCVIIGTNWKENKRLKRRREILHNTTNVNIFRPVTAPSWLRNLRYVNIARKTFLAGNRLVTYIFLFADLWAPYGFNLDTYIVNLDYDDKFTVFYRLMYIYIYIYKVCRSWVSCHWATYPEGIFTEIYTLVYFYPKVMVLVIKSHDKYQGIILVGLAPVKRANSGFWSIF